MDLATRQFPESATAERRASQRYPVTGEAEYRTVSRLESDGPRYGHVVDLSTDGLMLECSDGLQTGLQLEVIIPWTAGYGKASKIQFHVVGRTVRTEGNRTALKIEQSAFRFESKVG